MIIVDTSKLHCWPQGEIIKQRRVLSNCGKIFLYANISCPCFVCYPIQITSPCLNSYINKLVFFQVHNKFRLWQRECALVTPQKNYAYASSPASWILWVIYFVFLSCGQRCLILRLRETLYTGPLDVSNTIPWVYHNPRMVVANGSSLMMARIARVGWMPKPNKYHAFHHLYLIHYPWIETSYMRVSRS